jgi:Spy/CpxP family protein refolding chaperone
MPRTKNKMIRERERTMKKLLTILTASMVVIASALPAAAAVRNEEQSEHAAAMHKAKHSEHTFNAQKFFRNLQLNGK